MSFLRKHWSNILFGLLLIALLVPQTSKPIKVFVQRIIAFSPSSTDEEDREQLSFRTISFLNAEHEIVNMNELDDKPVLINFWATWCPPCIAEMPSMIKLYEDYKDEVHFLFVSNEDEMTISNFLSKQAWNVPWYQPYSGIPKELESSSIPATFIINEDDYIVLKKIGSANWNSKSVRSLLDEMIR